MPKTDWKACAICGLKFDGAEYLQVEIESSRRVEGSRPRFVQVITDASEDVARLRLSRQWYLGGWMKTRAVCLECVAELPPAWKKLFAPANLNDWLPVRRLDSGDEESNSEVWLVRQAPDHSSRDAEEGSR